MKYCPECGYLIADIEGNCPQCGFDIDSARKAEEERKAKAPNSVSPPVNRVAMSGICLSDGGLPPWALNNIVDLNETYPISPMSPLFYALAANPNTDSDEIKNNTEHEGKQ